MRAVAVTTSGSRPGVRKKRSDQLAGAALAGADRPSLPGDWAVRDLYKAAQKVNSSITTRDTVIDNTWTAFAHAGAAYTSVVEFRTRSGDTVRFTDGIGTYPAEYKIGSSVKVIYNPDDVKGARIYTWKRIWFAPTLITGIGALPFLIGIALAWFLRPKPSPESVDVGT